jgi:hypothetical protein
VAYFTESKGLGRVEEVVACVIVIYIIHGVRVGHLVGHLDPRGNDLDKLLGMLDDRVRFFGLQMEKLLPDGSRKGLVRPRAKLILGDAWA